MSGKDLGNAPKDELRKAPDEAEPMPSGEERAEKARAAELDEKAPRVGAFVADALALMRRRADGNALPIATPWPEVNKALGGGLWPGLHILTGATGDGKSQFALQVALTAAEKKTPVLYIGLELGQEELVARLLGLMMAEDRSPAPKWSALYLGQDKAALQAASDIYTPKLAALPLRLEVGGPFGWNAELLRARAEALRVEHPEPRGIGSLPMLVVLDYLQVIAPAREDGRPVRQELRERIGQAAYLGRAVARDLGVAVLMLSSVARERLRELSDHRHEGRLGDTEKLHPSELVGLGKESGEIEYAADTVLALCRGDFVEGEQTEMHLAVAKIRAGRPSWQRLVFNGAWFSPDDLTRRTVKG